MNPYYEDQFVTIYHGDCRDVLPTITPRSVDVVLTDPPFFMPAVHYAGRERYQRAWADTSILATFWAAVLDLSIPTLKPTGHLVTFCNGESYPVFYPEMYRRFDHLACLVWDKGSIGLGRIWRRQHELVIAGRWDGSTFSETGGARSDVLLAKVTPSEKREHPVEKPESLLRSLLEPTTHGAGVVLDPFAGSGSTLNAAKQMGLSAVGIEAEERYCEIAARRCAQDVLDFGIAA